MNKKRILIVDDESSFTRNVKLNLEKTGQYEVTEVNHSGHAVAVANVCKPDLILLDVMMPGLDGGDVLACLKADPALKDVPVLVLTATVKKAEVDSFAGVIGGYPFLAKPIKLEALVEHIEKQLAPSPRPSPTSRARGKSVRRS
jgi:CheY-like chemotaxis protein